MIRKGLGEVISPTSVVLLQELERFNKLIRRMSVSLSSLQKVECGEGREGGREEGRKGGREGGREGRRGVGREGGREGGSERGRE